ncbi:telomerase RNA component interacting RNase [Hyalella azteca]|uniref:Telomerase RNA component interacting RNase n=1 Tax=Hyalella azteca TaxID=294128 RepID=A0A8B7N2F8_HYAAZ|nr:telomerase RNA component interacting RNase [Hyalella azteca]
MADDSRSSAESSDSESSCDEERNQVDETQSASNVFKNDGSFLEMFKKMQDKKVQEECKLPQSVVKEESKDTTHTSSVQSEVLKASSCEPSSQSASTSATARKPFLSCVGKRRGGRILPTGIVKKAKKSQDGAQEAEPNDAWSRYLSEVRKYREQSCEEEGKRRPLVK